MFVSPAYAQAADGAGGGGLGSFLPIILIFAVFYFLLIRPQQKKQKEHRNMLGQVRRGDRVIMGGGIMGTVTKVIDDNEITVEIADGVKVRVQRALVAQVIAKIDPNQAAPAASNDDSQKKGGGLLGGLFGGSKK